MLIKLLNKYIDFCEILEKRKIKNRLKQDELEKSLTFNNIDLFMDSNNNLFVSARAMKISAAAE